MSEFTRSELNAIRLHTKAADGTRTHDLVLTKDALYQLSYSSPSSRRHAARRDPRVTVFIHLACRPTVVTSSIHCRRLTPKRVKGIEPSSSAWKAMALPLSYTRMQLSRRTTQLESSLTRRPISSTRSLSCQCSQLFIKWGVQDSNLRRHSHQIYSLTPLTARETPLRLRHRQSLSSRAGSFPSSLTAEQTCSIAHEPHLRAARPIAIRSSTS